MHKYHKLSTFISVEGLAFCFTIKNQPSLSMFTHGLMRNRHCTKQGDMQCPSGVATIQNSSHKGWPHSLLSEDQVSVLPPHPALVKQETNESITLRPQHIKQVSKIYTCYRLANHCMQIPELEIKNDCFNIGYKKKLLHLISLFLRQSPYSIKA